MEEFSWLSPNLVARSFLQEIHMITKDEDVCLPFDPDVESSIPRQHTPPLTRERDSFYSPTQVQVNRSTS